MTKNLIFYYSGTGNSLSVARELAEKLGEASVISLLSLEDDLMITSDVETVGFVYPIYINAIPRKVTEFISRIKFKRNSYIYAIATHGGAPGKAGCHLHKVLKSNGIDLNGYFEISMIINTPKGVAPKFLMKLDWEKDITDEKITPIIQKSIEQIKEIANFIKSRDTGSIAEVLAKEHGFNFQIMKLLWKLNERSRPKLHFLLDEGCVNCGICEKVCTTNRIKLLDGKPHWEGDECNYCYACFNFCPVQVIGVKYYTKKSGRYHFPGIGWKDIAAQNNHSKGKD